jgi:hypothetical protein
MAKYRVSMNKNSDMTAQGKTNKKGKRKQRTKKNGSAKAFYILT